MSQNSLEELYFSQSALAVYDKCPLKFRRRYLDGLYWPQDWSGSEEQYQAVEQGKLFHRLAQRYYTWGEDFQEGLLSKELSSWFQRLKEFRPYNQIDGFFPEHELRVKQSTIKLVAKYDLLFIDKKNNRVVIYDWKTNSKSRQSKYWVKHTQTRVYLYVLAKAGQLYFPQNDLSLKDLSLIYWNPRYPGKLETIRYDQKTFLGDELYLIEKIKEIKGLEYEQFRAADSERICRYCEYQPICYGKRPEQIEPEEDDLDLSLDWEAVDEIQF